MPLAKQIIDCVFAGSVDEDTDPRLVPIGSLLVADNVIPRKGGSKSKRGGYVATHNSSVSPSYVTPTTNGLAVYCGELSSGVVSTIIPQQPGDMRYVGAQQPITSSPSVARGVETRGFGSVLSRGIVTGGFNLAESLPTRTTDSAIIGNDLYILGGGGSVTGNTAMQITRIDLSRGITRKYEVPITNGSGNPVAELPHYLVCVPVGGTLVVASYNTDSFSSLFPFLLVQEITFPAIDSPTPPTVLEVRRTPTTGATVKSWDIIGLPDNHWALTTFINGEYDVKIHPIGGGAPTTVVFVSIGAPTSVGIGATGRFMTIARQTASNIVWSNYSVLGANATLQFSSSTTTALPLAFHSLATRIVCKPSLDSSGFPAAVDVAYSAVLEPFNGANQMRVYRSAVFRTAWSGGASLLGGPRVMGTCVIIGKPRAEGTKVLVPVLGLTDTGPVGTGVGSQSGDAYWVDLSYGVGRFVASSLGPLTRGSVVHIAGAAAPGKDLWDKDLPRFADLISTPAQGGTDSGSMLVGQGDDPVNVYLVNYAQDDARGHYADFSGSRYVADRGLLLLQRGRLVEATVQGVASITATAGPNVAQGILAPGNYVVGFRIVRIFSDGSVAYGAISPLRTVNVLGNSVLATVAISGTMLEDDKLQVLMTLANDSTLRLVDTREISDSIMSVLIPSIYPSSPIVPIGILRGNLAPCCTTVASAAGRLWVNDLADPNTVWFSLPATRGESAAFSRLNVVRTPQSADTVTALAGLDATLVIFTSKEIYLLNGQGPNDDGSGGQFGDPQLVSSNVGCVSPQSIVRTDDGLMFLSTSGRIMTLTRGYELQDTGKEIESTTKHYSSCRRGVLWESEGCVLWAFAFPSIPGIDFSRIVGYSYHYKSWFTWTVAPPNGQAYLNDMVITGTGDSQKPTLHYLASGTDFLQSVMSYKAGAAPGYDNTNTWVTSRIRTGPIRLSGISGYQRVYRVMPTFTIVSPANSNPQPLTVRVMYDQLGVNSETQTVTYQVPPNSLGKDGRVRLHLSKQRCNYVIVELSDVAPLASVNLDEVVGVSEWLGVSVEIGIKNGLRKLPSTLLK